MLQTDETDCNYSRNDLLGENVSPERCHLGERNQEPAPTLLVTGSPCDWTELSACLAPVSHYFRAAEPTL